MTKTIDVTAPVEQEGTKAVVQSWYVQPGESVKQGDPLVELETDKVAVEVPAPASGVLSEIVIDSGAEAAPGAVLGRLTQELSGKVQTETAVTVSKPAAVEKKAQAISNATEHRLSPAVRRIVTEHNIDPAEISGTGKDGRLTRGDVQSFLEEGGPPEPMNSRPTPKPKPARRGETVDTETGAALRVPHDTMRRRIAEHMAHSVATAPHVTAVFEADFSAVAAHRNTHKEEYARRGVKLTYTAYIVSACVEAMKVSPTVNSRWHDDHLDIFDDMNIGVGAALGNKGLVVPVIHQAQSKSHFGIATALQDLTERARSGNLAPADVRGGTFSISNHGTSGSLVASPIIINQPQSAILGVGKLEKRVVVRTVDGADAIQVRPMAFVSLTIDHRVLDGAQTNAWLTRFVEVLESWPAD